MAKHVCVEEGYDSDQLGTKTVLKSIGEWLRPNDSDLVLKSCYLTKWRGNLIIILSAGIS